MKFSFGAAVGIVYKAFAMKAPLCCRIAMGLMVLVALSVYCGAADNATGQAAKIFLSKYADGKPLDGLLAQVIAHWAYENSGHADISVQVTHSTNTSVVTQGSSTNRPMTLFFGEPAGTNSRSYPKPYYQALNSFCGPIELLDASGQKLPLLKPRVNSPEMYPASFRFSTNTEPPGFYGEDTGMIHMGRPWPNPLMTESPLLTRFELADYFQINKTGDYQLTVFPKIYKRSPRERDLFERMDLPPVSISFKLKGRTEK